MTCPFALKSNPGLISPSAVFGSAPAAEGGDAIEVPEHDSGDDDVGDRIGPVGDAVVLIAEEEAERRQEAGPDEGAERSEEHTSELQSLMSSSYAVFCWKKKKKETYTLVNMHRSTYTLKTNHICP